MKSNKNLKIIYLFFIILALAIGFIIFLAKQGPAEKGGEYKEDEILVQFKTDVSIETINAINKKFGTEIIRRSRFIPNLFRLKIIPGSSIFEVIEKYKNLPEVEYAHPNAPFKET